MRVLLVEDEHDVAEHIARALRASGFIVEQVGDGETAWFMGDTEDFAAVVLDLGLPGLDGATVLQRWREAGRKMPVLVLTARGTWKERVAGINAGADDYLAKPFRVEEVVARLRAILRRSAGQSHALIQAGPAVLDTRFMQLAVKGAPIQLSPLEYRAVSYLMHNQGRVVPSPELYDHVFGPGEPNSNTLESLIVRLRRKIAVDLIETRRGTGYTIPADHE